MCLLQEMLNLWQFSLGRPVSPTRPSQTSQSFLVEVVKSFIRISRDVVVADMSANTTSRVPGRFGDLADMSATAIYGERFPP